MRTARRVDALAFIGAALALVMAVLYELVIRAQGDEDPLVWVLAVLLVAAALAGYGARTSSAHRRGALLVAAVLLAGLGVVALLSIGLPIIVAGILCAVAAARAPGATRSA